MISQQRAEGRPRQGHNSLLKNVSPHDQHATTFDFAGFDTFGKSREGLIIRAISSHIRHLCLDELRANDHFALKHGFISDDQRQILEEIAKGNKQEVEQRDRLFFSEFTVLPASALITKLDSQKTSLSLNDQKPTGGLFGNTQLLAKTNFNQPPAAFGSSSTFAKKAIPAEPNPFNNSNNNVFSGEPKPTGSLFMGNGRASGNSFQPTGGSSLFANPSTSAGPQPKLSDSSLSANKNNLAAPFNNNSQITSSDQKPTGSLFMGKQSLGSIPQPTAKIGGPSLYANTTTTTGQNTTLNQGSNSFPPQLGSFNQAQLNEKPKEINQNVTMKKPLTNLDAEVKATNPKIPPSQNLEQIRITESKPDGFYQELTKRMFTANVMELFEQYEATVPEDLLENTDFMPKLFELFDNFKIDFTRKTVPKVKVSKPVDIDISSHTKKLEINPQGSEKKEISDREEEKYEEVKFNEIRPHVKSKRIIGKPDDDDDEEEDDSINKQEPQKQGGGLLLNRANEGNFINAGFDKQGPGLF